MFEERSLVKAYPVKTYLICGFLGAGKTTFILEHLKRSGGNVAVLVNEFGSLGIDGTTIQSKGGIDVVEMPGGCICCSQKQSLIDSIKDIVQQVRPELLLIEPSGVAEASELLATLSDSSLKGIIYLDALITIIDATTFLEFSEPDAFGTFFLDQVENADVVLINKTDLIELSELEAVEGRVRDINTEAVILKAEYCRLGSAFISSHQGERAIAFHKSSFAFSSLSIEPTHTLSNDVLERFIADLVDGRFGTILRAKGFLDIENYGCVSIQVTAGRVTVELQSKAVSPRLTVIGSHIEEDTLLHHFAATI